MSNFIYQIRKAHADYSTKFDRFQSGINRAHKRFHAIAQAAINRELARRFKLGHWCICWSHCMNNGEITPAVDLTDDKENAIPILVSPDAKRFPKIDKFTSWSLYWYLLKEQDIIVALDNNMTAMLVVFAPEQLATVETFMTENQYELYKVCL